MLIVMLFALATGASAANQPLLRDHSVADVMTHPSWSLMSATECGYSNQGRIIGGHEPELGAYPWIARLGYISFSERKYSVNILEPSFLCGGSLINERYVLTAAHCFIETNSPLELKMVRLGEHNARTNPDCDLEGICAPPVQDIDIEEFFSYIGYGVPQAQLHDIALLRLQHKAHMNEYVRPICLPYAHFMYKDYIGVNASVAGWGVTDIVRGGLSKVLMTVDVPIISAENCDGPGRIDRLDNELQICAGGVIGKDSCGGDSGGPLMVIDSIATGPVFFLAGLVSYGPSECGATRTPAVYTRTAAYLPWILDQMRP